MTPLSSRAFARPDPSPDGVTLLDQVRVGDTSAFQALINANWAPLVGYAARIVGDADGAEDVVQEAFVRLWERRADWRPKSEARAILYRIARNLALNQRQADSARASRASRLPSETRPSPLTPSDRLDQRELEAALETAIRGLPPRRREVLVLARFSGLSYQEIAETMGISVSTVANQMSAALADLDRALRDYLT